MEPQQQAAAVRRGAGLFALPHRGVVEVEGRDARRWLNGMISNDVSGLEPDGERSGCYAALLTRIGRIVADLHVLARPAGFWLELERSAASDVVGRLAKYVIADDVRLADRSDAWLRLALEGPDAPDLLGRASAGALPALGPESGCSLEIAGVACVAAAWSWSGEAGYQLFVPPSGGAAVTEALAAAGGPGGLVRGTPEALEVLRVEAGVPRLGFELGEDVLPPEARLEHAVSTTKGCYTGQEVIARIRSRGAVAHLLVGLACEGEPPARGSAVEVEGRAVGEVTSAVRSPVAGAIALAFVRRACAEPGQEVRVGGRPARVAVLPFAGPGSDRLP